MRVIIEKPVGGDGGEVMLDIDKGNVELKVSFPIAKLLDPVSTALENLKVKLEALIPAPVGAWVDPAIDTAFKAAEAEVLKLLSE